MFVNLICELRLFGVWSLVGPDIKLPFFIGGIMKKKSSKKGFTLIELLVAVLIIGILAAIALPQYQRVKEKSIMTEAVTVLKAIADAQQRFYMLNNRYADCTELDSLDIDLGGSSDCIYMGICGCKQTNEFIYLSSNQSGTSISQAFRTPLFKYYIQILPENINKIACDYSGNNNYQPSQIQKDLCDQLKETGSL